MVDFCVGLDTEFSEVVEGSHLYYPKIKLDQVASFFCGHFFFFFFACVCVPSYCIGDSSKRAKRPHTEYHQQF